jgi:hypothetical protein
MHLAPIPTVDVGGGESHRIGVDDIWGVMK